MNTLRKNSLQYAVWKFLKRCNLREILAKDCCVFEDGRFLHFLDYIY